MQTEFSESSVDILKILRQNYDAHENLLRRIEFLEQVVLHQRMLLINAGIEKVGTDSSSDGKGGLHMEVVYLGNKRGIGKKSNEPYNMLFYASPDVGIDGLEAKTAFLSPDLKFSFKPLQKINIEFGPRDRVVGVTGL